MTRREPIQWMTLGNMRQNDVPGLFVTCKACGYHMEVNADAGPDHVQSAYAVRKVRRAWWYGHSELE